MLRDQFNNVVISVKHNLIKIAKSLALEIRERFPQDELLEAMSVVYAQYWNSEHNREAKRVEFLEKNKNFSAPIWQETQCTRRRD